MNSVMLLFLPNPTLKVESATIKRGKMFIKRSIEPEIIEGARYYPVVAILGPRQSGKTTLAQAIFKRHTYISLEDPELRDAAQKDPRTFLIANASEHGIIIDEFQHVPSLLSYIQTTVDRERKKGFFILTGSQNFLMNQSISQSLAGRVSPHTLLPLSIEELKQSKLLPSEIEEMLFKGCYPAIYSEEIPPDRFYPNYIKTYVERDVRSLTNIGDLNLFRRFLGLCAARVGQLLNLTSLANDADISDKTAQRWLSILEASYIIFLLRPYHRNFGKRLIKSPKLLFYDPGLVSSLLKITETGLDIHPQRGGLFESLIISDIAKYSYNHSKNFDLYFWRDRSGHEIDCLIEGESTFLPIEIKASRTSSPRFFENLEYWSSLKETPEDNKYVIYAGSNKQPRATLYLVSWQNVHSIFTKK